MQHLQSKLKSEAKYGLIQASTILMHLASGIGGMLDTNIGIVCLLSMGEQPRNRINNYHPPC